MRNSKSILTFLSSAAVMAMVLVAAPASAQDVPLTIDPGGGGAAPPPASSAGAAPSSGVDFSEGAALESEGEPENFYYGDYLEDSDVGYSDRPDRRNNGVVPATHTAQSRDFEPTLDLPWQYSPPA